LEERPSVLVGLSWSLINEDSRSDRGCIARGNLRIETGKQEILLNRDDNGLLYENIYSAISRMTARKY